MNIQRKCPKCKNGLQHTKLTNRFWCWNCGKFYELEEVVSEKLLHQYYEN